MLNQKFEIYPSTVIPSDSGLNAFLENNNLSELKPWLEKYPFVELVFSIPNGKLEISLELNQIISATNELNIQSLVPNSYVIGNDAGDTIYLYVNDKSRVGVYSIDDDLSLNSLKFIAKSLDNWL